MSYDTNKIAAAIKKALERAHREAGLVDEGGSCNFDHAFISVPRMTERQAWEIALAACVSLRIHTYRWHGRILELPSVGSGARQTAMAEAMRDSLLEDGLNASVYYQLD